MRFREQIMVVFIYLPSAKKNEKKTSFFKTLNTLRTDFKDDSRKTILERFLERWYKINWIFSNDMKISFHNIFGS